MIMILLSSLTLLYLHHRCFAFDYCSIDCGSGPGMHTMCRNIAGGGKVCDNYRGEVSTKTRTVILGLHNEMRQKVALGGQEGQPPASNMMKLEWDNEVAMFAQRWAQQCEEFHPDECRDSRTGEKVGQNLGMRVGYQPSLEGIDRIINIVQSWYNEVDVLAVPTEENVNLDYFMSVGHYTQMIWGSTTRVGCGYNADNIEKFKYYLICNYVPAGNVMTEPAYKKGVACSECPPGTNCSKSYPGLCTADKNDIGDGVLPPTTSNNRTYSTGISVSPVKYWNLCVICTVLVSLCHLYSVLFTEVF